MVNYNKFFRLKSLLRDERAKLHSELVKYYYYLFHAMNWMFFLSIFFNIGALFLTNALIVGNDPGVMVLESNPVASELHSFDEHPEAKPLYLSFIIQCFFYLLLFVSFFMVKNSVYTEMQLFFSVGFIAFFCFITGYDFFNNLGYFIGRMIFL